MSKHEFGTHTVEIDDATGTLVGIPPVSMAAMIRRGLSHFFGNEIASKLTAAKAKHEGDKEKNPEGTSLTDDEVAALRTQFIGEAYAKLVDGKVGLVTPRAAADPLEAEVEKLAKANVRLILSNAGVKAPKADETVSLAGQDYTFEQLVERSIARNGEQFTKEAKVILRNKEKAKAAAAGHKKADEAQSLEDMGL